MKKLLLFLLFAVSLTSCTSANEYQNYSFFAMDTFAEVRIYSGDVDTIAATKSAQKVAEDIESKISKTLTDSFVYKLNSSPSVSIEKDETLMELMTLSMELAEITDGHFEPVSGGISELWELCESEQRLPTQAELDERVADIYNTIIRPDDDKLRKSGNAKLDFGAIGKGYAADKMVKDLKENGVKTGMVTFVSSVAVFGERDFNVAIRTPDSSGDIVGYLTLRDETLSVSGDYERFFTINGEKYNHIINPLNGNPTANGIHSVAVVCESAARSDALSTAIFSMGVEEMMELYSSGIPEFEALVITDEHVIMTPGMIEKFRLVNKNYNIAEN